MKCDQVQPELLDYSKGLLSGPESAKIAEHISRCAECAEVLKEEVAFARRLEALPDVEPENDVWALVRARTRPTRSISIDWLKAMLATNVRRATATAIAAALLAAGIYSLDKNEQQTAVEPVIEPPSVTVKWSDDPLGKHTDDMIDVISKM